MTCRPGPLNAITDVAGLLVGQATDERAATGVTALICPELWTAAIDIRGGGPGGRESAVMEPENLVPGVNAVVLTGGSVFGLAAADGVTTALAAAGRGLRLSPTGMAIPIVPAAVLHDLAGGGDKDWGLEPPYRRLGMAAVAAASADVAQGSVGAGRGAMAGTLKGGIGTASLDLGDGLMVGAIVAVNSVGSPYMPDGETFWAWPFEIEREFGGHRPRDVAPAIDPMPELTKLAGRLAPGANTMIGAVATTARLDRGGAKRLAIMAQDGFARAVRPAHTPFDGDTMFALAGGAVELGDSPAVTLARLGSAAADCVARAVARGVFAARSAGG